MRVRRGRYARTARKKWAAPRGSDKVLRTMENPACPLCRAPDAPQFYHRDPPHEFFRCADCGLVWLHPLPAPEVTAALYGDPYNGATEGYFTKVEKKIRRARGRARQLARAAPPPGRFLDIGCSGGFMVEAMRQEGFAAHGLDLDRAAIRWAEDHWPECRFYNEPVEAFAGRGLAFDAIYSSEVIEHVPDLHGFVATIARITKPGGTLYVTTPDVSHWRRPKDLGAWDAYCPPSHCIYYSPKNFEQLFRRHGFALIRRRLAFKPGIKCLFRRQ
jgi:SAM-dependent methyltransferase